MVAAATAVELTKADLKTDLVADPLGFLAGRRYTCYCGRSVVGTMLCGSCADEMVGYFFRVARQPAADHVPRSSEQRNAKNG